MTDDILIGGVEKRDVVIADYDPRWPATFQRHAATISGALADKALSIEHIGSTSVLQLAAKPIVDLLVVVEDSGDEAAYLPALLRAGYVLRVREPDWHRHRMVRTPELDVHVHILSAGCPEIARYLIFRDRLRTHASDRLLYESVKRRLAAQSWPDMNAYARAKTEVVEQIIARAEQALTLTDGGTAENGRCGCSGPQVARLPSNRQSSNHQSSNHQSSINRH
jgi:GrpB-like predicted nucleotidyltransferase (UPF0157 family)